MKVKLLTASRIKKTGLDPIITNGDGLHPIMNLKNNQKHTLLQKEE